jgi:hypothetical protein
MTSLIWKIRNKRSVSMRYIKPRIVSTNSAMSSVASVGLKPGNTIDSVQNDSNMYSANPAYEADE